MVFTAPEWQRQIYLNGISGTKPLIPTNWEELEQKAAQKMSKKAWAYVSGGAGHGHTIEQNREGFAQWGIVPRMLCDVSEREIGITLFGRKLSSPFLLCPIGVLEMAHSEADLAVARAAAAMGVPYIFSSQASVKMEDCAQAMGNMPRWFQLYWSKSDALTLSFVRRAEACGCEAIVVTLDTTMLGWRTLDLDLAYLPFLQGKGIAQYTSDPVFGQLLEQQEVANSPQLPKPKVTLQTLKTLFTLAKNYPNGSFLNNLISGEPLRAIRKFTAIYSRPSLTWDNLKWLRQQTRLPILLKGILHPNDAQHALDAGIDGIIISNHGGRQIDGEISTIEALPRIAAVIGQKIPLLLDSGVRGGADVFKALALGASAVCIGRPYVYALAIAGQKGVEVLLQNYMSDFELTMALAGCCSVADISRLALLDLQEER